MKPPLLLLLAASAALAALGATPEEPVRNPFAGDEWKLPPETPAWKAAPGVEEMKNNCQLCHSTEYIATQPALTRAQWTAGVEKMRGKFGAVIATNKVPAIVNYLVANYGRENPAK